MSERLQRGDLNPADVLLMQGRSFISDLIRIFDQGKYSHAAIFDGNNVVEMLSQGTTVRGLKESVADMRFVDVYRFVGDNGQLLGTPGLDPQPVLDRIQFYENDPERYGYEQIVLLALLCSTRTEAQKNLPPFLAMILRQILDSAAEELARMIHDNKTPMICSELVYRCYAEAGPPYALHVRGSDVAKMRIRGATAAIAETITPEEVAFNQEAAAFLRNYAIAKRRSLSTRESALAAAPFDAASTVAAFVTPRDLETSPNLQMVGTLA